MLLDSRHERTCRLAQDHHQIQKATLYGVSDVCAPNLIGAGDLHIPQHIRIDPVVGGRGARGLVDRLQAHASTRAPGDDQQTDLPGAIAGSSDGNHKTDTAWRAGQSVASIPMSPGFRRWAGNRERSG